MDEAEALAQRLVKRLIEVGPCVVAFSGGVDSSVVAYAAHQANQTSVAITGLGPAVSQIDRECAKKVAAHIGIDHVLVESGEIFDSNYQRNDERRCFYCKDSLYRSLHSAALERGLSTICSGTNHDDLSDYRPGLQAAETHQVRAPLAELGFSKAVVRQLATWWKLPVADRAASPCLSSRLAYGVSVTPQRLAMIEQAEVYLRDLGFTELRVRLHEHDLARIELPKPLLADFVNRCDLDQLNAHFRSLGFRFITIDLAGFHSGSLNSLLPILNQA